MTKVLERAEKLVEQYRARFPTPELNELIERVQEEHPAPLSKGHRVKLFYVAQVAYAPPTFVIQCSRPEAIPDSYRRFVENRLREAFGLEVPMRLVFKERKRRKPAAAAGARVMACRGRPALPLTPRGAPPRLARIFWGFPARARADEATCRRPTRITRKDMKEPDKFQQAATQAAGWIADAAQARRHRGRRRRRASVVADRGPLGHERGARGARRRGRGGPARHDGRRDLERPAARASRARSSRASEARQRAVVDAAEKVLAAHAGDRRRAARRARPRRRAREARRLGRREGRLREVPRGRAAGRLAPLRRARGDRDRGGGEGEPRRRGRRVRAARSRGPGVRRPRRPRAGARARPRREGRRREGDPRRLRRPPQGVAAHRQRPRSGSPGSVASR